MRACIVHRHLSLADLPVKAAIMHGAPRRCMKPVRFENFHTADVTQRAA